MFSSWSGGERPVGRRQVLGQLTGGASLVVAGAVTGGWAPGLAHAQDAFPQRAIRVIVPQPPGGGALADVQARIKGGLPRLKALDSTLPEAVDRIVMRCLETDPAARFQTSAELAAALAKLDDNGVPIPEPRVV